MNHKSHLPRKERCRLRLTLAIAFVVFVGAARAGSEMQKPIGFFPADPKLNWTLELFMWPCHHPLCREMTKLVMRQKSSRISFSRLVDSPDARKLGFSVPRWTRRSYRAHIAQIKKSVTSEKTVLGLSVIEALKAAHPNATQDELGEELWKKFGPAILSLFEHNQASIESSQFDVDNNRTIDTILRIAIIEPVNNKDHGTLDLYSEWQVRRCGLEREHPCHNFTVDLSNSTELSQEYRDNMLSTIDGHGTAAEIFEYRGRAYKLEYDTTEDDGAIVTMFRHGGYFLTESIWKGWWRHGREASSLVPRRVWDERAPSSNFAGR